jgi:hypothetical protein
MSGGRGGGWGVKKCFLVLRRTALLSAEGKNGCARLISILGVMLCISIGREVLAQNMQKEEAAKQSVLLSFMSPKSSNKFILFRHK